MVLPSLDSDLGVVVHLLLAESQTPSFAAYHVPSVLRGMHAMKATVANRLALNPSWFAAAGASNFRDIVSAPGQFRGFSKDSTGRLVLHPSVLQRILEIVSQATADPGGRFASHVELARSVSEASVSDPFVLLRKIGDVQVLGGTYGWRTAGSSAPGGRFVQVPEADGGVIGGNQFYTLKKQ